MFPHTRQSVLERVHSDDADARRAAIGDLVTGYWQPAYRYLRLHWRLAPADAEDAVQGFFTIAFEKDYLEAFDPHRGRFRTFLRVCLDRHVQHDRQRARAAKRGGGTILASLDFPGAEADLPAAVAAVGDAERFFHDETIRSLFGRAVDRLRRQYAAEGRSVVFEVFDRHDLSPAPETTYASIAASLTLTPSQVTNYLHQARRGFRSAALAELRAISTTDAEYRMEARALFGAEVEA